MTIQNRERQRKWKQKQVLNGLRAVTVMLPKDIKDLIDRERQQTGDTIAGVIERAVINLLASAEMISNTSVEPDSSNVQRGVPTEEIRQIAAEFKGIVHRMEKLTDTESAVTSNPMAVTNDGSEKIEWQDSYPKEIYRLVRLLHNMEVSHDEIAFTLNKRKYKTLSGENEWKLGDIKAILDEINQKYGHIDPLFSISDNP